MRPVACRVLQILASVAVVVLASGMLLVFAEGIASFGVGRTTAAEISFGLLILGSFIVYRLTARR